MKLEISHADCGMALFVDRDCVVIPGTVNEQGLDVRIGNLWLHFEDEGDAADLARAILDRLGER